MILSTSKNFIFLHIHKTGGTSITAVLEPYLAADDLVLHHSFERLPRRRRKQFAQYRSLRKHSPAVDVMAVVPKQQWNDSYRFAFVRHPIDRSISFYNFCADQHAKRKTVTPRHAVFYTPLARDDDPFRWPGIRAFAETATFSEFIRHPELATDMAMQPQYHSICDRNGELAVDFVGRYERFDDDLAIVQRKIGVPTVVAKRENVSQAQLLSRSTILTEDSEFLAQMFAIDFSKLGYQL